MFSLINVTWCAQQMCCLNISTCDTLFSSHKVGKYITYTLQYFHKPCRITALSKILVTYFISNGCNSCNTEQLQDGTSTRPSEHKPEQAQPQWAVDRMSTCPSSNEQSKSKCFLYNCLTGKFYPRSAYWWLVLCQLTQPTAHLCSCSFLLSLVIYTAYA